jgi:hypothetical protein
LRLVVVGLLHLLSHLHLLSSLYKPKLLLLLCESLLQFRYYGRCIFCGVRRGLFMLLLLRLTWMSMRGKGEGRRLLNAMLLRLTGLLLLRRSFVLFVLW